MSIATLNDRFGIANHIHFDAGPNGFPIVEVENEWATARAALHGAHVLAFAPKGQQPVLWLSDQAIYRDGQALRGGIPVIWPWFGPHPTDPAIGSHGFVRNHDWQIVAAQMSSSGSTIIHFQYNDSGASRTIWPDPFRLNLVVEVGQELTVTLKTENIGPNEFSYTAALHSYFAVSDSREIELSGLDGVDYLDKPMGFVARRQRGPVTFCGEVDRVYQGTRSDCLIIDKGWDRTIRVAKRGSDTTVVWNPGPEVVKGMTDFADENYTDMVCVETANAHDDSIVLPAGGQAELTTIISVS